MNGNGLREYRWTRLGGRKVCVILVWEEQIPLSVRERLGDGILPEWVEGPQRERWAMRMEEKLGNECVSVWIMEGEQGVLGNPALDIGLFSFGTPTTSSSYLVSMASSCGIFQVNLACWPLGPSATLAAQGRLFTVDGSPCLRHTTIGSFYPDSWCHLKPSN